uniref:Uncharacterized protein n=1 Tax=Eutreptiella gymnastica TaxID=73025 RepID=A0A7S4CF38_9EUGL
MKRGSHVRHHCAAAVALRLDCGAPQCRAVLLNSVASLGTITCATGQKPKVRMPQSMWCVLTTHLTSDPGTYPSRVSRQWGWSRPSRGRSDGLGGSMAPGQIRAKHMVATRTRAARLPLTGPSCRIVTCHFTYPNGAKHGLEVAPVHHPVFLGRTCRVRVSVGTRPF